MSLLPAPDYTVYPTGDDLLAAFQSTGLVENPPVDEAALINWNAKMLGAVSEWEAKTGYHPFLSTGTETTWTYDAECVQNGILSFDNGLISLTSITVDGAALVGTTDYVLSPQNAALRNQPYKRVTFRGRSFSPTSVITVIGVHGYSTTLPPDVWEALVNRGKVACAPELALQISGGTTDIRAGKVQLSFVRSSGNRASSGGPLSGESQQWTNYWSGKILQYRR